MDIRRKQQKLILDKKWLLGIIAFFTCIVTGIGIAQYDFLPAILLFVIVVAIIIFRWPKFGIWLVPIATLFSPMDPLGIGFSPEKLLMGVVFLSWLVNSKSVKSEKFAFPSSIKIAFGVYITICAISLALPSASLSHGFTALQSLIFKGLLVFLIFKLFTNCNDVVISIHFMAALSILAFGWMMYMIITMGDILMFRLKPDDELLRSTMSSTIFANPNIASFYGIILYPIMLAMAMRHRNQLLGYVYFLIAGLAVLGVLFTFSRSGLVAITIVSIYLLYNFRLNIKVLIVSGLIFIGVYFLISNTHYFTENILRAILGQDPSSLARIAVIRTSWKSFLESPILGAGIGNFSLRMEKFYGEFRYLHFGISAHNDWVNVLVETGILGVIPFVVLTAAYIKLIVGTSKLLIRKSELWWVFIGVSGSLLGAFIDSFFHRAFIHNLLWFVIGLSIFIWKIAVQNQAQEIQ